MKSFTGHYAGKSSLGLRRADLFRDAWQHCRRLPQPLLKEKLRGHWTLPYASKPEKSPLASGEGLGQLGRWLGRAAAHQLFLPLLLSTWCLQDLRSWLTTRELWERMRFCRQNSTSLECWHALRVNNNISVLPCSHLYYKC